MSPERKKYENLQQLHASEGRRNYILEVFGDALAKKHSYQFLGGMDAVYFYLMKKHNWLPRDVRSMSPEDLRFALHEEMQDWTWPKDSRPRSDSEPVEPESTEG
jgi:hypothetical protein